MSQQEYFDKTTVLFDHLAAQDHTDSEVKVRAEYGGRDDYNRVESAIRCRAAQEYIAFMDIKASAKEIATFIVTKHAGQPTITRGVDWGNSNKSDIAFAFVCRNYGFKNEHLKLLRSHFGVKG